MRKPSTSNPQVIHEGEVRVSGVVPDLREPREARGQLRGSIVTEQSPGLGDGNNLNANRSCNHAKGVVQCKEGRREDLGLHEGLRHTHGEGDGARREPAARSAADVG